MLSGINACDATKAVPAVGMSYVYHVKPEGTFIEDAIHKTTERRAGCEL